MTSMRSLALVVFAFGLPCSVVSAQASVPPGRGVQVAARLQDTSQQLLDMARRESGENTDLIHAVQKAVTDPDPKVRANAMAAVATAIQSLLSKLDTRTQARRSELTASLTPVALAASGDEDASVRRMALYALATLHSQPDTSEEQQTRTETRALRMFEQDPDDRVRATALQLLSSQAYKRSTPLDEKLLEAGLRDSSSSVRNQAYQAAGMTQAHGALPLLIEALDKEVDSFALLNAAAALQGFVVSRPDLVDTVEARAARESQPYIKEQLTMIVGRLRAALKQVAWF